jgi:hypothetical protein
MHLEVWTAEIAGDTTLWGVFESWDQFFDALPHGEHRETWFVRAMSSHVRLVVVF